MSEPAAYSRRRPSASGALHAHGARGVGLALRLERVGDFQLPG